MDIRKFVFIKAYKTIPVGSEITLFRNLIYLNGGLILPVYQDELKKIINDDNLFNMYLKEVNVIKNKI